ncbi:DUF2110 family protein [Halorubrum sp. CBA1229]|jgi:hypothetical protein|uniref:DUF2110 family protein n=1 Tax=Halorubrum sp. CBA1229 TaxID=1853699 RepID=UPI000F41AC64|nr:DUF2110 family protein [Halorubrum sp. CBA1229]QKY17525.1 DUF2110 family protein [Halorubrum sp. CBA1229]
MVVLATKCYVEGDARDRALDGMGSLVANDVGELSVEWQVGVRDDDFVQVDVTGEDAEVARNVLAETWGEIVAHDGGLAAGEEYVGTLESWDDDGFVLDAGVEVRIPADEIGLGRGSPAQVVERFGLVQHLSLRFVYGGDVGDPDAEPSRLADAERDRLYDWQRGDGRVNVNSATRGEVRATVNRAGHAQDIVTVERLGLLEQSIVCTENTDPPGLLAAIGSYLPAEMRCVV